MPKWKVTYELRSTHIMTVEADTLQDAEESVCWASWGKHRDSIYDILETEQVEGKVHKVYSGQSNID